MLQRTATLPLINEPTECPSRFGRLFRLARPNPGILSLRHNRLCRTPRHHPLSVGTLSEPEGCPIGLGGFSA